MHDHRTMYVGGAHIPVNRSLRLCNRAEANIMGNFKVTVFTRCSSSIESTQLFCPYINCGSSALK